MSYYTTPDCGCIAEESRYEREEKREKEIAEDDRVSEGEQRLNSR